ESHISVAHQLRRSCSITATPGLVPYAPRGNPALPLPVRRAISGAAARRFATAPGRFDSAHRAFLWRGTMIRVVLAQPRGFCAGVERAIEIVERALKKYGPPIYVRHEIVHNRHVVEDLRTRGAVFVDELD